MGQDFAVRRTSPRGERHQERALEPAAVLVAALEIHVRGPAKVGVARQHGLMARPGVELLHMGVGVEYPQPGEELNRVEETAARSVTRAVITPMHRSA